jgi:hypothetical protein
MEKENILISHNKFHLESDYIHITGQERREGSWVRIAYQGRGRKAIGIAIAKQGGKKTPRFILRMNGVEKVTGFTLRMNGVEKVT